MTFPSPEPPPLGPPPPAATRPLPPFPPPMAMPPGMPPMMPLAYRGPPWAPELNLGPPNRQWEVPEAAAKAGRGPWTWQLYADRMRLIAPEGGMPTDIGHSEVT